MKILRSAIRQINSNGCRRIQNLQHLGTVAELRNLIKAHVMDELAALEQDPSLECLILPSVTSISFALDS